MKKKLYIAYGSNINLEQMAHRCPNSKVVSKEMMKGYKWELFVLLFSFFWWYVLGVITFGLAYIYVIPYVEATVVNFYEKIKPVNPSSITA